MSQEPPPSSGSPPGYNPPSQPQGSYSPPPAPSGAEYNAAPTAATTADRGSGMPTAALVLGIISIPAALFAILGFILGILAVVFGFLGRQSVRPGRAQAGIITGAIGIVLSIISAIIGVMMRMNH